MTPKAPIPFQGFDEASNFRFYENGILPHWRQPGCTYFVTFRLADSIPKKVLLQIEHERSLWLKSRSIDPTASGWRYRFAKLPQADRQQYEKLVGRLFNRSLDECHGKCLLRDQSTASEVADALDYFHGQRVLTGDYVVMPNHVHALLTPISGFELEDILHSIKSFTGNKINRMHDRDGALWQRESYDHIVRDMDQLDAFRNYIAINPAKAKLMRGEYLHAHAEYTLAH